MFDLTTLLLQLILILCTARLVGRVFRHFHQPQVMGEMMAGIFLGPSVLGLLAPGVLGFVFPPQSLDFINALSQVGLVIFMFQVGLELNPRGLMELVEHQPGKWRYYTDGLHHVRHHGDRHHPHDGSHPQPSLPLQAG